VAIVCEHAFEPDPAPAEIELVPLYDDPPQVLLPAGHGLARAPSVSPGELAEETWVRAHHGSAARLVDHVLAAAGLRPRLLLAGHGDEPVEAQAFIAAGRGVTVAHALTMLISHERVSVVPLAGGRPVRHIQVAIMRDERAPLPRAVVDALREVGRDRARR
jgi:DNA-binding transcriptional LysR family regulator